MKEKSTPTSITADTHEMRIAIREWLSGSHWNHFVTFNFNTHTTLESGKTTLKRFHAKLDRQLYGRNFNTLDMHDRTIFIAFPEHEHSNLHYHAFLHTKHPGFSSAAIKSWASVIPSGSLQIANLCEQHAQQQDYDAIARYITKELTYSAAYDRFIISGEFSTI